MADSIVTVPSTAKYDYDYLAFSFNGKHSWDDFNIYRVSDGDRYNIDIGPQSQDKTAENSSGDGIYFFGSQHKSKVFNINFAFDSLTDSKLRALKEWLSVKDICDLWFEEEPYKVYSVKVTGQPSIKVIPFDGVGQREYRGEGSVQFTAYWPYAHTPDYVRSKTFDLKAGQFQQIGNGNISTRYFYIEGAENANKIIQFQYSKDGGTNWQWSSSAGQDPENPQIIDLGKISIVKLVKSTKNVSITIYKTTGTSASSRKTLIYKEWAGKEIGSYSSFQNRGLWQGASGLSSSSNTCKGENPGDLPAPFVFKHGSKTTDFTIRENDSRTFQVGNLKITVGGNGSKSLTGVTWDSKTGMVSAKVDGASDYTPIPYTGTSVGGIPVGGTTALGLYNGTLKYHYWYY